jgi:hypothetical protein
MSRTSVKHADIEDVDRVEDSEELGAHSHSLGDDNDAAILVKLWIVALLLAQGKSLF